MSNFSLDFIFKFLKYMRIFSKHKSTLVSPFSAASWINALWIRCEGGAGDSGFAMFQKYTYNFDGEA